VINRGLLSEYYMQVPLHVLHFRRTSPDRSIHMTENTHLHASINFTVTCVVCTAQNSLIWKKPMVSNNKIREIFTLALDGGVRLASHLGYFTL
jgi:hypothetical protein